MCSQFILNNLSCYVDNFGLIIKPIVDALSLGIFSGALVGILLLLIRNN